jgi:NAD+ diphosphatase
MATYTYCPQCATALAWLTRDEDGGAKARLRCPACDFVHWNNPTPVLAAIVQVGDKVLMARNAAWRGRRFGLITGFMEAGESPEAGTAREVKEETDLTVSDSTLIGAYDFLRMNQVIIAYHVRAQGQVRLSPELAEHQWFSPAEIVCWPSGTGFALAAWQRSLGIEPRFMTMEEREALGRDLNPVQTEKT